MMRITRRVLPAFLLALALLLPACGRPFGDDGGTGPRFTPSISRLQISAGNVFCDEEFEISFNFSDPQKDITRIDLVFSGESGGLVTESLDWNDTTRVTHPKDAVSGTATITFAFNCEDDNPADTYELSVTVIDSKDHVSNVLTDTIKLL